MPLVKGFLLARGRGWGVIDNRAAISDGRMNPKMRLGSKLYRPRGPYIRLGHLTCCALSMVGNPVGPSLHEISTMALRDHHL